MKYLLILSILISCGSESRTNLNTEEKDNNDKFLLSLKKNETVDKGNYIITSFEKSKLVKVLNKEKGILEYKFGDKKVLSTEKECLFLNEIFDGRFLFLSHGSSKVNISVAGPENFERDTIYIIDNESGEVLMCKFKEPSYLTSYEGSLNPNSLKKNVYAVKKIDFKVKKLFLVNNKNEETGLALSALSSNEINCIE